MSSKRRQRRRVERIEQREIRRQDEGEFTDLLENLRPLLTAFGEELAGEADPFEAEVNGWEVLGMFSTLGPDVTEEFAQLMVADIATQHDTAARALLTFMGVSPYPVLSDLAKEADALLEIEEVPTPDWIDALTQPIEPARFTRATTEDGTHAYVLATFRRSDEEHGFLISLDYADCGAITMIDAVAGEELPEMTDAAKSGELLEGTPTTVEELTAAEAGPFLHGAVMTTFDHRADDVDRDPRADDLLEEPIDDELLPGRMMLLGRYLHMSGIQGTPPAHGEHLPEPQPGHR